MYQNKTKYLLKIEIKNKTKKKKSNGLLLPYAGFTIYGVNLKNIFGSDYNLEKLMISCNFSVLYMLLKYCIVVV